MLKKILRTVIGLPFVILAWAFVLLWTVIVIAFDAVLWSFTNDFDDETVGAVMRACALPYHFLKQVWGW